MEAHHRTAATVVTEAIQPSLFDLPTLPRPVLARVTRVVPVARSEHSTIAEQFAAFDAANPAVYEALRHLALDLVRRGQKRIGIGMLYEVLRWQAAIATTDADSCFSLNNNLRALYARALMAREPELAGVFEVRELRS